MKSILSRQGDRLLNLQNPRPLQVRGRFEQLETRACLSATTMSEIWPQAGFEIVELVASEQVVTVDVSVSTAIIVDLSELIAPPASFQSDDQNDDESSVIPEDPTMGMTPTTPGTSGPDGSQPTPPGVQLPPIVDSGSGLEVGYGPELPVPPEVEPTDNSIVESGPGASSGSDLGTSHTPDAVAPPIEPILRAPLESNDGPKVVSVRTLTMAVSFDSLNPILESPKLQDISTLLESDSDNLRQSLAVEAHVTSSLGFTEDPMGKLVSETKMSSFVSALFSPKTPPVPMAPIPLARPSSLTKKIRPRIATVEPMLPGWPLDAEPVGEGGEFERPSVPPLVVPVQAAKTTESQPNDAETSWVDPKQEESQPQGELHLGSAGWKSLLGGWIVCLVGLSPIVTSQRDEERELRDKIQS